MNYLQRFLLSKSESHRLARVSQGRMKSFIHRSKRLLESFEEPGEKMEKDEHIQTRTHHNTSQCMSKECDPGSEGRG